MSDMVVNESLTVTLDASPAATLDALRGADLTGPLTGALRALGASSRLALPPEVLDGAEGDVLRLGMIWRIDEGDPVRVVGAGAFDAFARPGHVKASWELAVTAAADAGAHLSIRTRLLGTDAGAHARLLDAWAAVGLLSRGLTRRAARSVRARAEGDERWDAAA
jgi:hypothetical protein